MIAGIPTFPAGRRFTGPAGRIWRLRPLPPADDGSDSESIFVQLDNKGRAGESVDPARSWMTTGNFPALEVGGYRSTLYVCSDVVGPVNCSGVEVRLP